MCEMMKEERKTILIGSCFNFIIAIIKMFGGLLFQVNALLVDSIYSFCDFVTDIISIISSKLAGKRPSKHHPYGFGRVEYITNLFVSMLLLAVGIFLLINAFKAQLEVPNLWALSIVFISLILKTVVVMFLQVKNKRLKSKTIDDGIEESILDLYSSILIGIAIILLQFSDKIEIFKYSDLFVSVFMSFLIMKTAFILLKNNILNLLGTIEVDEKLISTIKEQINIDNKIEISEIELIKYGRYYKAHLVLCLNGDLTLKKARQIERKVIKKLKKLKDIKIKVINIDLDVL